VVLFAASPVLASDPAEAGSQLSGLLWQILNLAILLGVLVYVGRKPLAKFFAERGTRIRTDLEAAASLLAEAEANYSQWQHKLIELDEELARIRTDGRRRVEQERETILAEAQAAADRIHRDAVATVEQELRRAQASLRAEAAVLATEIAEQILRDRLDEGDLDRLMDEFIARIEPATGAPPGGRA
jgi:F-type H+-transporting ATPase subunit b